LSGIIHVIDCVSGSILPLPVDTEYLALSYVWGPPPETGSLKQAFRKFEVLKNVPRTIADAMAVTLLLDYQYLWCDRYCIDQDDPVTKALQLSLMDRIYEAAKVTLVAGSGVDDSYGLPGSGTLPLVSRDTQSQAWIGSHRVIPVGPDIPTTVRQSKWATRAWT
ncbi:heterokaryon incompatibility, partial [Tricladium varicosporioides]